MSKIKAVDRLIEYRFSDSNFTVQKKATALLYYNFLMLTLLPLLVITYAVISPENLARGSAGAGGIFIIVLISTVLLLKGKLTGAVLSYLIPTIIMILAARFINAARMPHGAFTAYLYYNFYIIVFVAVFGKKIYVPAVTLLFLVSNIAVYMMVKSQLDPQQLFTASTGVANSSPALLITGIISYINIRLTTYSNEKHKEQAESSIRQVGIINNILHKIKGISESLESTSKSYNITAGHITGSSQSQASLLEEATAAMEQIASAIENVSDRVKVQADQINSIEKSMESLNSIITELSERAAEIMNEAGTAHKQGAEADTVSARLMESMKEINGNAEKIREITDLITDIADKTSLLALNASIESARAGEAGKGFSVVADEISKLADSSTTSAKEISKLISNTGSSINNSYELFSVLYNHIRNINVTLEKSGTLSREMNKSAAKQFELSGNVKKDIDQVNLLALHITDAMKEQAVSTGELSLSLESINQATQGIAATAEELHSSTDDLAGNIGLLLEIIKMSEEEKKV